MKLVDFSHLKTVGETYWQHFSWCVYAVATFVYMIVLSTIHGIFPFLIPNYPDRVMVRFLEKFKSRRVRTGQADRLPESS